jgi:hypothetical protein
MRFYEQVLSEDLDSFTISPQYAPALPPISLGIKLRFIRQRFEPLWKGGECWPGGLSPSPKKTSGRKASNITPCCTTATLTVERAEQVFEYTQSISREMRLDHLPGC